MSRPQESHQPGRPKAQAGLELASSYGECFPHCAAAGAPIDPCSAASRTIQLRLWYSYVPIDLGRYPPRCTASCSVTSSLILASHPSAPPGWSLLRAKASQSSGWGWSCHGTRSTILRIVLQLPQTPPARACHLEVSVPAVWEKESTHISGLQGSHFLRPAPRIKASPSAIFLTPRLPMPSAPYLSPPHLRPLGQSDPVCSPLESQFHRPNTLSPEPRPTLFLSAFLRAKGDIAVLCSTPFVTAVNPPLTRNSTIHNVSA